jgi:hypothetical protein
MAGKNLAQTLRDFDRHYMPDCPPDPDASAMLLHHDVNGAIDNYQV